MLSRILGRQRWTHKDPAIRLAAVADLDPGTDDGRKVFADLAGADPDAAVRVAATQRLDDTSLLLQLLNDPEAKVARAAAERCAHLAGNGHPALLEHPDVAWRVALSGAPAAASADLLQHIKDESRLVDLAVQARTAAVRQAAAERIITAEGLDQLAQQARSRDKSTWRTAKARLAERQQCQQALEQARTAVQAACSQLQTLAATNPEQLPPDARHRLGHSRSLADTALAALAAANSAAAAWSLAPVQPAPLAAEVSAAADAAQLVLAAHDQALAEAEAARAAAAAPRAQTAAPATGQPAAQATEQPDPAADPGPDLANPAATGNSPDSGDPAAHPETKAAAAGDDQAAATASPQPAAVVPISGADQARYEAELEAAALALETFQEQLQRQPEVWLAEDTQARFDSIEQRWLAASDHVPPTKVLASVQHPREQQLRQGLAAAARLQEHQAALQQATGDGVPALPDVSAANDFQALWAFQATSRHRAQTLSKLERQVAWPDQLPCPDLLVRALAAREALESADQAIHDRHEQLKSDVRDAENQLDHALTAGDLGAARQHFRQCRDLVHRLPKGSARRLQRRFGSLAHQLHELQDWQTFATHPKREQLAEAMTALHQQPKAPADQADAIRVLRKEWNDLGPVASPEDHRLAKAFNEAAEAAFEPCRSWYKEQAEQRNWNLENRRKICSELERYLAETNWPGSTDDSSGGSVDWRAAERIQRTARTEWQRYSPVDRKAGRSIETRFQALANSLHEHISAEYRRNLASKEAIAAEAEALLTDAAPLRDRLNSAKQLQSRWKQVGMVPRKPDQALWQRFRKACDALFAAREDEQQQRDAEAATALNEAAAALAEFEALVRDTSSQAADQAQLRQAEKHWAEVLDQVPPRQRGALDKSFRSAADTYRQLLREQENLAELATGRALLAALDQGADADLSAVPAALRAQVQLAEHAASTSNPDAIAEARRQATIRMEILAGVESPAADQALRMQTQVERLNAGFGGSTEEPDILDLLLHWLNAGPAQPGDPELRRRADHALTVICRGKAPAAS